jgi:hypothetical protein
MYTFEAFVTYTGREAVSTDTFEVMGQTVQPQGAQDNTLLYIIAGIAAVGAVAAVLLKRR